MIIPTPFYWLGFHTTLGYVLILWLTMFYGSLNLVRLVFLWLKHGQKHFYVVDREVHKPALLDDTRLGKHRKVELTKQAIALHIVESGDASKQLMLLVHGFPECWYSWKNQIIEFSNKYHVVAVNMRGYGESDKPIDVRDYSTDKLVADLAQLIEQLSPKRKCILVAHDWGGVVAWLLAGQHPDLVDRFIVMNAPHPHKWIAKINTSWRQFFSSWYMFFFNSPYLPEVSIMSKDFYMFDRLFGKHLNGDEIEIYKYYFGKCFGVTGPLNYYRAMLRAHAKQKKDKILPKTLIIWGDQDVALVSSLATDSLAMCQDGRVRMVEGASHWVQLDRPKDVNYHMQLFLGD